MIRGYDYPEYYDNQECPRCGGTGYTEAGKFNLETQEEEWCEVCEYEELPDMPPGEEECEKLLKQGVYYVKGEATVCDCCDGSGELTPNAYERYWQDEQTYGI